MKAVRIIAAVITLAALITLSSCGDSGTSDEAGYDGEFLEELHEKIDEVEEAIEESSAEETETEMPETEEVYVFEEKPDSEQYGEPVERGASGYYSDDKVVYITPTGECYHFDPDCGGKNSSPTTLSRAEGEYRPCKKCADG